VKKALTEVKGVGPARAKILSKNGIDSIEKLASVSVEQLSEVPGFGLERAPGIIASAKAILAENESAGSEAKAGSGGEKPAKVTQAESGSKGKRKGKGKGKGKG